MTNSKAGPSNPNPNPNHNPDPNLRIGVVVLPDLSWQEAKWRWQKVEQLGFDHGWTYDHLAWRTLADGPWFGSIPMLTAAATATTTLRLGTFVASPNFRHPVAFAKELMTLDDISGGRITAGLGAGGMGYDYTVLGGVPLSLGQRSARFEEFVDLLDRLLTNAYVTHYGEYYEAIDTRMIPGCRQSPRLPFVIAANGPRMMRLAAEKGQGWVTTGDMAADDPEVWWASVQVASARMDEVLATSGTRDHFDRVLHLDASGSYSMQSLAYFTDCIGRAAELGFTDVVTHFPRAEGLYAGEVEVLESVAEQYCLTGPR